MKLPVLILIFCCSVAAQPYLVLHKGDGSLGWYSAGGRMDLKVKVGQHPHEMVFSADRRLLYTTDNGTMKIEEAGKGGNTVSVVDIQKRVRIATISLGEFYRPHGIDLEAGVLAVTTENPDQLLILDPEKRLVLRRFQTGGQTPHMVKLSRDGRTAFISHSRSGNVTAVDTGTGAVTSIPTGERPEGSALSPDGRTLYVVNRESAKVSVIDTVSRKVTGEIVTAKGPVRVAVTPDGKTIVVACMHDEAVEIVDAASRKVVAHIPLKGKPVSMHLSPDGGLAFASVEDQDHVFVVSIPARKIVRDFRTPKGYAPDPVMAGPVPIGAR